MGTIKILFFRFLIVAILFLRPTSARLIRLTNRTERVSYISDPPSSSIPVVHSSSSIVLAPSLPEEENLHTENHHHSSVAGGGVIIGGFVTALFAAVYCYIRVTRKRDGEKH